MQWLVVCKTLVQLIFWEESDMAYDTESTLRWMDEDLYDEYKKKEIRDSVPSLPERSRRFSTSDMNISDARNLIAWEQKEGEDIKVGGIRPTTKIQDTMPFFSPIPTARPKTPSVDSVPQLPQTTSITDIMSKAHQANRKDIEKQRSSDLAIARMHAMSDVMGTLFTPVAWRMGGGGTDFTTVVPQQNKGYIEAFNRARQASDKIINLDAEYQNRMANYAIDQNLLAEKRAYQQQQQEEERQWREAHLAKEWEYRDANAKHEQEAEAALEKMRHENEMAEIKQRNKYPQQYETKQPPKKPVRMYTVNGQYLEFESSEDMADFYEFAGSYMNKEQKLAGIDDSMSDKEAQAKEIANIKAYIIDNASTLYDSWKNGTPMTQQETSSPQNESQLQRRATAHLFTSPDPRGGAKKLEQETSSPQNESQLQRRAAAHLFTSPDPRGGAKKSVKEEFGLI